LVLRLHLHLPLRRHHHRHRHRRGAQIKRSKLHRRCRSSRISSISSMMLFNMILLPFLTTLLYLHLHLLSRHRHRHRHRRLHLRQQSGGGTFSGRGRVRWWWWISVFAFLLMILWTLTATTTILTTYFPRSTMMMSASPSTSTSLSPTPVPAVVGNERNEKQQQHIGLHHEDLPQAKRRNRDPDLHVVIAYCRMSFDWIFDEFLKDYYYDDHGNFDISSSLAVADDDEEEEQRYKQPLDRIKSIWIYSKCQSSKSESESENENDDSGGSSDMKRKEEEKNLNMIRERLVNFFSNRINKTMTTTSMKNEEGVVRIHHHQQQQQGQTKQQIPQIFIDSSLPNVGRCDHTYAYWIYNYASKTSPPSNTTKFHFNLNDDDEVLFIKDNNNKDHVGYIQLNTFQEMEKLLYGSRRNHHGGERRRRNRKQNRNRIDRRNERNLQWRSTTQLNSQRLRRQGLDHEHGYTNGERGFGCSTRISWKGWNQRVPDLIDATTLGNFYLKDYVRDFHETHSHSNTNSSRQDDEIDGDASNLMSDHLIAQFESPHRPLRRFVEEMKIHIDGIPTKTTTEDMDETHDTHDKALLYLLSGPISKRTLLGETTFVPICYCGSFLTQVRQIRRAPIDDWSLLLQALSRGDNIEEGHYMERLWAALLSDPLTIEEQESLRRQVVSWDENGTPYIDPTRWIENTQLIQ